MQLRKLLIAAMGLTMAAGVAGVGSAETPWQPHHPRRYEVNHRLDRMDRRVREERREGELSRHEARYLHARFHHIRVEERRFARHDGGHISLREQARLNHQETMARRHIPA
jgi:hypothetical protein